ncbi:hypothetical protein KP509_26G029600 [Ceratopteris richardii]|uniref:Membrane insertase YidC/Oxa/ALB C-terminal domain-containing protein n=1 Tax=Ceratopteris richardii TaxID=49495 RepID=A0A8T2RM07_CERRI|nr:hypothetical protein KP509_26G029600 [Ceratopteris richardii]
MACPLSTLISPLCGTGISTRNAHLYFTPSSFTRYQRRYCFDPFQSHNSRERGKYTLKSGGTLAVRASLADFDGHVQATSQFLSTGLPQLMEKAEGLLYTIADAAVSVDSAATETVQKTNRDWLSGLTDVLESILKVLKDGLQALHVPYSYGFAIILLTILVKAATFPLSKQQVESSLAMQNLAPKIKAIQQRYAGDQERIQLETARLYKQAGVNPLAGCLPTLATIPVWIGLYRALSNVANEGLLTEGFFWIPSLSGPTTIAARQSGSGISWLFPFVDGAPPLGWGDTAAYLVLPLLLVISQYVSMQLMQTPQSNDPSQKNTQAILKFLPLMIGYFSLSVPSGLSLYWLTNNILSTGQQLLLRRGNNSKGPTSVDGGEIISAGQALRSSAPAPVVEKKDTRGERFRQLKMEEARKKAERAEASRKGTESPAGVSASETPAYVTSDNERDSGTDNEGDETDEETTELSSAKDSLEEIYSRSESSDSKQGKRSKRKRAA